MQRLRAWEWSFNLAKEKPLTGAGFGAFVAHRVERRDGSVKAAESHSNYFQALGEHGFPGLFLYLALCFVAFQSTQRILRSTAGRHDMTYERDLGLMCQLCLVGYYVGGLTITHTYYELFYVLIGVIYVTRRSVEEKMTHAEKGQPG